MQWAAKQKGFTIVELLIVVVVIAILAAITIVAYNGITQRAQAAATQTAISSAQKKLAAYKIDNNEQYPTSLDALGLTSGTGTVYQFTANNATTPAGYCVTATTGNSIYHMGTSYTYTTGGSTATLNDSSFQAGPCPGHSGPGGTSITNYALNPSVETNTSSLNGPNSATFAQSSVRAKDGTRSALVTLATAKTIGTTGLGIFVPTSYISMGLKPNTTYTATAYVYVPTGTVSIQMSVQGSGRASVENPSGRTTFVKDQWVRIQNSFVTAASDGNISVYLLNNETTPGSATQFWADSFIVTEGASVPAFADGNTSGWVWNGVTNNSSSTGPAL